MRRLLAGTRSFRQQQEQRHWHLKKKKNCLFGSDRKRACSLKHPTLWFALWPPGELWPPRVNQQLPNPVTQKREVTFCYRMRMEGIWRGSPHWKVLFMFFPLRCTTGGRPLWCAALTSNQPVVHSRHSFHFTFNFNFSMLIRENPINPVILGSFKGAICIFAEDIFIYLSLKQYNK